MLSSRRTVLKALGIAAAMPVPVALSALKKPTEQFSISNQRGVEIFSYGPIKSNCTVEECKALIQRAGASPEDLACLILAKEIVQKLILPHPDNEFKQQVLTCPEFSAIIPRLEPMLQDVNHI